MEAVQIQAVEAGAPCCRTPGVVGMQPSKKIDDVAVAPHPSRKAGEVAQRRFRVGFPARLLHPAVHAIGIGPVGFDRDDVEAVALDQRFRQLRARAVELVRAM